MCRRPHLHQLNRNWNKQINRTFWLIIIYILSIRSKSIEFGHKIIPQSRACEALLARFAIPRPTRWSQTNFSSSDFLGVVPERPEQEISSLNKIFHKFFENFTIQTQEFLNQCVRVNVIHRSFNWVSHRSDVSALIQQRQLSVLWVKILVKN